MISRIKRIYLKQQTTIKIFLLFCGINIAIELYKYGLSFPLNQRVRGDAFVYLNIAHSFSSFSDAFSYISDRTYGFPLFLYLVKRIFSPENVNAWVNQISYVQFCFHIFACFMFYVFFIKKIFFSKKNHSLSGIIAITLIVAYPTLVTYTTSPLTDVFCADLIMLAIIILFSLKNITRISTFFYQSIICGLILGYTIAVRPGFMPPIFGLLIGCLFYILIEKSLQLKNFIKLFLICSGIIIMIGPAMYKIWQKDHIIGLQNEQFIAHGKALTFQSGLAGVRIFWSSKNPSRLELPGVYDPTLKKNYYNKCAARSLNEWGQCMLQAPHLIPVYFWKKLLALFDVPNLQPYTVDLTPKWFIDFERLFGMIAFCGLIASIFIVIYNFLNSIQQHSIYPLGFFLFILMLQHSIFHVEGRYIFSSIPFFITFLFLALSEIYKKNTFVFIIFISLLVLSGISFLYQVNVWDRITPI